MHAYFLLKNVNASKKRAGHFLYNICHIFYELPTKVKENIRLIADIQHQRVALQNAPTYA